MRFSFKKSTLFVSTLVLLSLYLTACGILGEKDKKAQTIEVKSGSGCLNNIGANADLFFDGAIDQKTWENTWDCTVDSIELFQQFVRGSEGDAYTQKDMIGFVAKFLITNKEVSPEMISASFALKAALFGGSKDLLTHDELSKFIKFLQEAKFASVELIPLLKARIENPNSENLLKLSNAVERFGARIGDVIGKNNNTDLLVDDIRTFILEIGKLQQWKVNLAWVDLGVVTKQLLFGGASDRIEAGLWTTLFKRASVFGSVALAMASVDKEIMKGPNEYGSFFVNLIDRVTSILSMSADEQKGVITYDQLDSFVDKLMTAFATTGQIKVGLPRKGGAVVSPIPIASRNAPSWSTLDHAVVKQTLRPVIQKLFHAQTTLGLDRDAIDYIMNVVNEWNRKQTHLEAIFQNYKLDINGVNKTLFIDSAQKYSKNLDSQGQDDVTYLIGIVNYYKSLFSGLDEEISFIPLYSYSLNNISKFVWMNIAAREVLKAYASDKVHLLANKQSLITLLDDNNFHGIGVETHFLDGSVKSDKIAEKRFTEADLFTFVSNGDGYLNLEEITYYLAYVYSSFTLTTTIHNTFEPDNGSILCQWKDRTKDPLDWHWLDPVCFRTEYFYRVSNYWKKFNFLLNYYNNLSSSDKTAMQHAIEDSARRYGYINSQPVGKTDVAGFATIMHYVETLFMRFDTNIDQVLDTDEILKAFPTFKTTIINAALASGASIDPSDTKTLEAVFTYIVKYGKKPENTLAGKLEFLWWKTWRQFWDIHATRKDVFNIIPIMISKEAPPPES